MTGLLFGMIIGFVGNWIVMSIAVLIWLATVAAHTRRLQYRGRR